MQAVDLLEVTLKEHHAASRPEVPHPAKRIQATDWTTDRES